MPKISASSDANQSVFLQAARSIIRKEGFRKVSMGAIAEKAGLSRRTLYRAFHSRDVLLAELIGQHGSDKINDLNVTKSNFRAFFIEAATSAIPLIQKDPVMMEMIFGGGAQWYQQQMLDEESPVFKTVMEINLGFWSDVLNTGKAEGLVNPNLSNEEIMRWYTAIQYMMIIRVNASIAEHRQLMEKFFLPSIRP